MGPNENLEGGGKAKASNGYWLGIFSKKITKQHLLNNIYKINTKFKIIFNFYLKTIFENLLKIIVRIEKY